MPTTTNTPSPSLSIVTDNLGGTADDRIHALATVLSEGPHREAFIEALDAFNAVHGRPAVYGEAVEIEQSIRAANVAAIVKTANGRPAWRAETVKDHDPATFGLNLADSVPSIWGVGEHAYWAEGELAIMYGGDGTNKTTVAHNLVAGMLGFNGFETVLGYPVRRLDGSEKILYLAHDRPRQIERSWSRYMRPEYADQTADRIVWRTEALPFDAAAHPLWLAEWVAETYPDTYAVIFDNVWDSFGDFSDTANATSAGIALNNLARSGINPLALHHDRKSKTDRGSKTPPETDDGMYGGRNFKAKAGTIVNLWKSIDDGSMMVVTQHKEPSERIPPTTVLVDQPTGTLMAITASGTTPADYLRGYPDQWHDIRSLSKIHHSTEDPTAAEKEATRRHLDGLGDLVEYRKPPSKGRAGAWKWAK